MSKRQTIPPIKATPGLGQETANDPAIVWTGGRVPEQSKQPGASRTLKGSKQPGGTATSKQSGASKSSKQPGGTATSKQPGASKSSKSTKRKTDQTSIGIVNRPQLQRLMKRWNLSMSGVVNMALAKLAHDSLKKDTR